MIFTSTTYLLFFGIVFSIYWLIGNKSWQNLLLLASSYIFYGFVHPWFCILMAASTIFDFFCAIAMEESANRRKAFLVLSLVFNLGMLSTFKYFNFFSVSVHDLLQQLGCDVRLTTLNVILPVGISFYTFQSLSYTVDVYRGDLRARRNLIDFALFVSFFPQLVAGPIERATRLLPQVELPRLWRWQHLYSAAPLILMGYMKKLVIADNVSVYADKVFMLEQPSVVLLLAGTAAFAIQIFADFSAYTDIARGSAKLLGFDLIENFNAPYLAISPSDFWRRWHISFSTWIRDYVYIPLGGSKGASLWKFGLVVITTMGLSGLWHGAAWNFIVWGFFHGVVLFVYHLLGLGGRWQPNGRGQAVAAWAFMLAVTLMGWALFRCPSLEWLLNVFVHGSWGLVGAQAQAALFVLFLTGVYASPWLLLYLLERYAPQRYWLRVSYRWGLVGLIAIFANANPKEFIYFQF